MMEESNFTKSLMKFLKASNDVKNYINSNVSDINNLYWVKSFTKFYDMAVDLYINQYKKIIDEPTEENIILEKSFFPNVRKMFYDIYCLYQEDILDSFYFDGDKKKMNILWLKISSYIDKKTVDY